MSKNEQNNVNGKAVVRKIIILCACLILSVVSIWIIGRNVINYIKAEQEAKEIAAEKIRIEQRERERLAQVERQRQERKRKQAEIRNLKQELQAQAESLDYERKYYEASKALTDYYGKYSKETYSWRNELAGKYMAKHQKEIEKQREETVSQVISLLFSRDYKKANQALQKYPPPIPKNLQSTITELADVDERIAKTFVKDIGGLVVVSLDSGSALTANLSGIEDDKLVIEHRGKKQTVSVSEIAIIERKKRVDFLSKEAQALYLGVDAWKRGEKKQAYTYFKKLPEFFSKQFTLRVGTEEGNKTETNARVTLIKLLQDAFLIDDDIDKDLIRSRLTTREVGIAKDRQLKKQLDDFIQHYQRTNIFLKNENIITEISNYLTEKVDFLDFVLLSGASNEVKTATLSDQPPEAFWDVLPTSNPRKYAKLKTGKHGSVNVVVELGKKTTAQFAFDDDTEFPSKPKLSLNKWQSVIFLCKYGNGMPPRKYALEFKYANNKGKLLYRTACVRRGIVKIDNSLYEVTIINHAADGNYSGRSTELSIKNLSTKKKLTKLGMFYQEKGKQHEFVSINSAGTHVKFK